MGILPIGFFSPLPLAMMIPFMATQSLAMGEAFGKSFQYGKRKISSMSNEEFNKLTFLDLMKEQTANIKAIIPDLNAQMAVSQTMQKAIFQEMINLIPTFFESFKKALPGDVVETSSQASPLPEIQQIRYTTDRNFELQQDRIDDALKLFNDNFLKQQGTKESLAAKLAAPELIPEEIPYTTPPEKRIPSRETLSASTDPVYLAWITKLGHLKELYQILQQAIQQNSYSSKRMNFNFPRVNSLSAAKSEKFSITSRIRAMSRDYRNPNNHIRLNALRLRANMSQWS